MNHADDDDQTALCAANAHGHQNVVVLLLVAKAEVNHADDYDLTALYAASAHCHQNVVVHLLAAKAEVNQQTIMT